MGFEYRPIDEVVEMYDNLYKTTKQLLKYNEKSLQLFMEARENDIAEVDFFNEVKPYADKVKETADKWKIHAIEWANYEKPKYIHSQQVETTYENLLTVSIQGFYKDTSKKRFQATIQSNQFFLENVLSKLKN